MRVWLHLLSYAVVAQAAGSGRVIADFEGAGALAGWTGMLSVGAGHNGQGARLEYAGGAATATWTPPRPLSFKHKGAVALWIQASPEVRLSLVISGEHRYPFEVTTL